jgi:REP element-mobilizing transposase RayT
MPRHPRLFLPGAIYHVYCRVARGEFVFDDDFEAMEFIEILRKVRDLDGWTVFAWCLMGNHHHLVVRTRDVDLWRSMARLQGSVARNHNRRHRYLGRLWQSRYRARVIDTNEYFRQVVAYVHLNPVAAGVVDDPAEYPYSGHREIVGVCRPHIVNRRAVLNGFGADDVRAPADEYLHWVRLVAEARWANTGVSELPWWIQANHVDEIADADLHPDATTFDGLWLAEERAKLDLGEFATRFEAASGNALDDLASRFRSTEQVRGRIELSTLAAGRYGLRVRDIASLINKHRNSVTKWLNKGLCREGTDPEFKKRLDDLDAAISSRG